MEPRGLAARLDEEPAVEVALFRDGSDAVARRHGEELRFAPAEAGLGWQLTGDAALLAGPDALRRAWAALAKPERG